MIFKRKSFTGLIIVLILVWSAILSQYTFGSNENCGKLKWKWQVDDLLVSDRASGFQLSPDGKKLVWRVSRWNLIEQKKYHVLYLSHLDILENKKPKRIQLTRGEDMFYSIKWVPGENKISFMSNRIPKNTPPGNLWVMNLEGGEPYPVTFFETGLRQYEWIDKDNLMIISGETKSLYQQEKMKRKDTAELVEDEDHRMITRLFTYNPNTGESRRLTGNIKPLQSFSLSPNKEWVIYEISMSLQYRVDDRVRPRFYLMHLKSGETREIFTESSLNPHRFKWAKDSSGFYTIVAYNTHPRYIYPFVRKVYWYSLDTGKCSEVNLQWERYLEDIVVAPDGFIAALLDGVYYKYARYFKKGNTWKRKWIKGDFQRHVQYLQLAEDGKTMVYRYSTASLPRYHYLAELKGDRFVQKHEVMDIDYVLYKLPLTETKIITWKGARDEPIEGILYFPFNYREGEKYPLIVMIHGGPNMADMDVFVDWWMTPAHLLAERGAFILKVNYHGSSNYGLEFGESIIGHYNEYEIIDIERGVDYLISRGKIDQEKLGIMGYSNGAVLGAALTVHTNRYKAACLGAGVVNYISDYGSSEVGVGFYNFFFAGPPWERVDYYIKKSPFFQLKKVTTPTLISHGARDRICSSGQAREYYRALQQIGKAPVRFVSFPDEGHPIMKLAHQRRKLNEEIQWFEKYLFNTFQEKNESLKKDSPLDRLATFLNIRKVDGWYGGYGSENENKSVLIPEIVDYMGVKIGRFEVTRAQWAAFDKNYHFEKGTGNYPVTGITFVQAQNYVEWLSRITGEIYRLPGKDEEKFLYSQRFGNTFDYWAGYVLNPDDYRTLLWVLKKYKENPVLLKPVGSFTGKGKNPVFDLGGNAAEWVLSDGDKGKVCGGSAERPTDSRSHIEPRLWYTGFRVVKE